MKLTDKQAKLWKLANAKLLELGGIGRITRNPDKSIRDAAKINGTKEWALVESTRLASPLMDGMMNDDHCQELINIIGDC